MQTAEIIRVSSPTALSLSGYPPLSRTGQQQLALIVFIQMVIWIEWKHLSPAFYFQWLETLKTMQDYETQTKTHSLGA